MLGRLVALSDEGAARRGTVVRPGAAVGRAVVVVVVGAGAGAAEVDVGVQQTGEAAEGEADRVVRETIQGNNSCMQCCCS